MCCLQAHGLQEEVEEHTEAKEPAGAAADSDSDDDGEYKEREKELNNDIESQVDRMMAKAVCCACAAWYSFIHHFGLAVDAGDQRCCWTASPRTMYEF